MKKIIKRRRTFRINNPLAFGLLCAVILILLVGIGYALVAGLITPAVREYQLANATPSPTPTIAPVTSAPSPTPDLNEPTPTPSLAPGTTPTPTLPPPGKLEGLVIGIDPARGYSSTVRGVSTKTYANRLNFAIATLVKDKLQADGATVVFTLSDVKDSKEAAARATMLNNGNVALAVRIECNYVNATDTRGAMVWIPASHDKKSDCKKLAESVLNAYIKSTDLSRREIKGESVIEKTDETFLNNTKAPVCTFIMGHISNAAEDKKLNDADFQQKMATGIVNGILNYLGVS